MTWKRIVASTAGIVGMIVLIGSLTPAGSASGTQAQPRDPRPGVPRPASALEQAVQAATVAEPANVKHWLQLAALQEERGAPAEAEGTFKAALTATGGAREVLMALAGFFNRTGQFALAVAALEEAAARNPGDPAGHQLVAVFYWEKAQKDRALSPADKLTYIEAGIGATDRALMHDADHVEALTYKNVLLRMKANLETDVSRRQALIAQAETLRTRAIELAGARGGSQQASPHSGPPPPPPPPPPGSDQVDPQAPLRVGGTIRTPRKIHDVRPLYPPEALDARVSGLVVLEAVIDQQGNVRSVQVLKSVPMLDQAAIDAVKGWRYEPTLLNGVPVPVIMTVTVTFNLHPPRQ
jgi:TonB family protein